MTSGSFPYPRPGSSNAPVDRGYSWQDTVVANWTSTATNSTPCQISMFFWLASATQDWVSSGWFDVPCTGTRATPLDIVHQPYLGQFNFNYTDTGGLSALYMSSVFRVDAPKDTTPKTFPLSAAPTSPASSTPSTPSASSPASTSSPAASPIAPSAADSARSGIIAGSGVGAVVILLAIVGVIFYCLRKRRRGAGSNAPLRPSEKMEDMEGSHDKGLAYDHWRKNPLVDPTYGLELDARWGLATPAEMEATKRSEMPVEPVEVEASRRGEMPG